MAARGDDHRALDQLVRRHQDRSDPAETVTARVDVGLALIPEEFRIGVVLRDIAGLGYAEIGHALDLAPGTVRSRIARGRSLLADAIAGNRCPTDERHSPGR